MFEKRSEGGKPDETHQSTRRGVFFTFTSLQTMDVTSSSKSKHKRSHDKDRDSSSRKRAKHKHHGKKSSKKNEDHLHVVDDDVDDEDLWIEKNVDMDGEKVLSDGLASLFANYKT